MVKQRKKRDNRHLELVFWVASLALILVIFFLNKDTIDQVLKNTGFSDIVQSKIQEPVKVIISSAPESLQDKVNTNTTQNSKEKIDSKETPSKTINNNNNPLSKKKDNNTQATATTIPSSIKNIQHARKSKLYYIKILKEGTIVAESVERAIVHSESPLKDTINTLLKGPTSKEIAQGFLNLIPKGSHLKRVWINNNIAYLDFNEAFLFNNAGFEGATAQVQQIVLSALQFSTVSAVQILIDGNSVDYLNEEGIYIGKPISRKNLFTQKTES